MVDMEVVKKNIRLFVNCLVVFIICGLVYAFLIQPPQKTDKIYAGALELVQKNEYSKAYFEFSKVIFSSPLKPLAIYHQAVCANKIEDYDGAVKKYRLFLLLYPRHTLATKVKYNLAQALLDKDPLKAKKYFESIINQSPNSDYAIASEYYAGLLMLKEYENQKIFPLSVKNDIENHFRHYLKQAPSGRLALNVIENWNKIDKNISKDDYLLMAKSYYLFRDYKNAETYAKKADLKNAWALEVKNAAAAGNVSRAIYLTEWGLNGNADYIDKEDVYSAIDTYMTLVPSKYQAAVKLIGISKTRGKDYLMDIKCRYSPAAEKLACYKNLYLWFPTSEFVEDAQSQVFLHMFRANDYANAQRIGISFLNKYKNSEYTPMVMYYMGRLSESVKSYQDYISYYRSVISKYPDSYYAYRAYLRLEHIKGPLITSYISEKPVEFPYERRHTFLDRLILLKDFEVLEEYSNYDDFIKSWVLYKKGDFKQSIVVARNAMDKIQQKPDKRDLRWRLVYPVVYYNDIKHYADKAGNNAPLMLSIAREESYFDSNARSVVGAKGLMQLMPTTAAEIAAKHSVSAYNLANPSHNVMLGNYYYSFIKGLLGGMDVSAIAAYNGGIGSVNSWKSSIYYNDTDAFIEQIPYPETQNYVKKVLRSYWNYIRVYNGNS